ncbi:MAG: MoaD/ThiS family protein [Betaproteobacteria bacterium]|nr:MoaD/ThiS family protein [Betaproteobacteria bacterium]
MDDKTIGIHVTWKLPWRAGQDGEMRVPKGRRVAEILTLLGEGERTEDILVVRNQHMCDGTEELLPGDRLIILPVISGG